MPRTASTSLFHILGEHPRIFRPFRKEVGYFLFNHHRPEQWYLDAYADAASAQRCIDVTPEYFFSPDAVRRIAAFGDGVRVVIGVRDPASFAQSLYAEYSKRYRMPPFEEFVAGYAYARGSRRIEFSLASGVIRGMLEMYAREIPGGVLFYDFSAFRADPLAVLNAIESFIGVERYFTPATFHNVRMNNRDRRTNPWLSRLLSAEPLIDGASRLLPASAMRAIAGRVYRGGTPAGTPPAEPPVPSWLRDTLRADEEYVTRLFEGRAVHIARGSSVTSQR
jgi:hypothetical protein